MADTAQNLVAAQSRSGKGKGPARRLRQQGLIPAVVYGLQAQPTSVAVDPAAVMKAIATPHKRNTLITLKLEQGDKQVLFKDYQVDPVSRRLLHADFLEVTLDKLRGPIGKVTAVARVDGHIAAEGEITFAIADRSALR